MLETLLREVLKTVTCVKTHVVSEIQIVLKFFICFALFDTIIIYQNHCFLFNLSDVVDVVVMLELCFQSF